MAVPQSLKLHEVVFGPDDAKGDANIQRYFVPTRDMDGLQDGRKRYIIGRKGTGKSAVIENIKINSLNSFDSRYIYVSLRDFPLGLLREFEDKSFRDKTKYQSIWELMLYLTIARMVVEDESIPSTEPSKVAVQSFVDANFPGNDVGYVSALGILKSKESKLSFLPEWLGMDRTKGTSVEAHVEVHFTKLSEPLAKLINAAPITSSYFILFDELDDGYRAGDTNNRLILLGLLKAVEGIAIRAKENHRPIFPIIALRSDIFDRLDDNDINKLDDYIVRLNWTSELGVAHSMRRVFNARVPALGGEHRLGHGRHARLRHDLGKLHHAGRRRWHGHGQPAWWPLFGWADLWSGHHLHGQSARSGNGGCRRGLQ